MFGIYKHLHEERVKGKRQNGGSGFTCKEQNKLAGHLLQTIRSVAVEKNPPMDYPFV